jgi:hypothetical protein
VRRVAHLSSLALLRGNLLVRVPINVAARVSSRLMMVAVRRVVELIDDVLLVPEAPLPTRRRSNVCLRLVVVSGRPFVDTFLGHRTSCPVPHVVVVMHILVCESRVLRQGLLGCLLYAAGSPSIFALALD